ncbi:MAG: hypothetical protein RL662_970 [Bacteroidota bacterium]|jgi:hypothetical protein
MNELEINYSYTKTQKLFYLVVGAYISLYGMYKCVLLALANTLSIEFYLALTALILGVIQILAVTLWVSKPIFRVDSESIYVNMVNLKSVYTAHWIDIKEVGLGISYLKFTETNGKAYQVDISELKYNDLKSVKSKIIEFCESKRIPYRND